MEAPLWHRFVAQLAPQLRPQSGERTGHPKDWPKFELWALNCVKLGENREGENLSSGGKQQQQLLRLLQSAFSPPIGAHGRWKVFTFEKSFRKRRLTHRGHS